MKILIENQAFPFFLAHGGEQIQILKTYEGLKSIGVDVELTRWWDDQQSADLIHCFGTPNLAYVRMAKRKGISVVNTTLFTATCNRSHRRLRLQGSVVGGLLNLPQIPPWSLIRNQLKWESFRECDSNIVGLEAEKDVLKTVYGVAADRIDLLPLGLSDEFLTAGSGSRSDDYLITTGTITERKRSIELAKMAIQARTPICFVGKPYDPQENYWHRFSELIDGNFVRHIPHVENTSHLIALLQQAKGYVLYSDYENWCLAAHEAIACGLPVLVPDQRWSRERFGDQARFFSKSDHRSDTQILRQFWHDAAELAPPSISLMSWTEVAAQLLSIYNAVRHRNLRERHIH